VSTTEVDIWHYINKIKKIILYIYIYIYKREKEEALAGLGWPNHPMGGGSATPWQKKKRFWPMGVVRPLMAKHSIFFLGFWPMSVVHSIHYFILET